MELPVELATLFLGGVEELELPQGHLLGGVGLDQVEELSELLAPKPAGEEPAVERIADGIAKDAGVDPQQAPLRPPLPLDEELPRPVRARRAELAGGRSCGEGVAGGVEGHRQHRLGDAFVQGRLVGEQLQLPRLDLVGSFDSQTRLAEEDHLHRSLADRRGRKDQALLDVEHGETGVDLQVLDLDRSLEVEPGSLDLSPVQPSGSVAQLQLGSVGNDRALLMQGFGPQVYAMSQLLELVDVPPSTPAQETRVMSLEYATAEELQPIISKVLEERTRRLQAKGISGGEIAAGAQGSQLTIEALTSHNALLISGGARGRSIAGATTLSPSSTSRSKPVVGRHPCHPAQATCWPRTCTTTLRQFLQEDLSRPRSQAQASAGQRSQTRRERRTTVIVAHTESNSLLVSATQTKFKQLERMIREPRQAGSRR